jgi:hypothetical protein
MPKIVIFSGVLILHWIAQFLAWSYAERSAAMRIIWIVLATPIVHAGGSVASQYFWILVTANSVLWASIVTYLMRYRRSPSFCREHRGKV